jgi:hypothetical protein
MSWRAVTAARGLRKAMLELVAAWTSTVVVGRHSRGSVGGGVRSAGRTVRGADPGQMVMRQRLENLIGVYGRTLAGRAAGAS